MNHLLSFRYFLLPYLFFILVAFILIMSTGHGDVVLWINARRNDVLDFFFTYWTYLGDGAIFGVIFLGLVIRRWKIGVVFALTGLVQLIISSTFKRIIFPSIPRPQKFFMGQDVLSFIEGVEVHSSYSFPSGHSMTAFTVATFLSILMKEDEQKWSLMLLLTAVLVAISRMYLLQHFLIDVTVGSLIGVVLAVVMVMLFKKFMERGKPDFGT